MSFRWTSSNFAFWYHSSQNLSHAWNIVNLIGLFPIRKYSYSMSIWEVDQYCMLHHCYWKNRSSRADTSNLLNHLHWDCIRSFGFQPQYLQNHLVAFPYSLLWSFDQKYNAGKNTRLFLQILHAFLALRHHQLSELNQFLGFLFTLLRFSWCRV